MKLKTQEKINLILFLSNVILYVQNSEMIHQIEKVIDPRFLNYLDDIYLMQLYTTMRVEKLSIEYKELKKTYHEVLCHIEQLLKELQLKDPVSIFACYVYMLRNGYFSNQHNFQYSFDMKDFADLHGIDIIRGKGVCRSISSFCTDIYRQMDYISHNITVYATDASCEHSQSLCDCKMNSTSKNGISIPFLPIANHVITTVEYNQVNYIFDPTNDGFLLKKGHKFVLANRTDFKMTPRYLSMSLYAILGAYKMFFLPNLLHQLSLPSIEEQEYREIYLKTLKLCKNNMDVLEKFYQNNQELYEYIVQISDEQHNIAKRMFPIFPFR